MEDAQEKWQRSPSASGAAGTARWAAAGPTQCPERGQQAPG